MQVSIFMSFPTLTESRRLEMLQPPEAQVRMVLDTDTYNEIDDQFAVVHAILSPEQLNLEAIYAAPFHNNRSSNPEDGMEKSYDEIIRLLDYLDVESDGFVFKGSRAFLLDDDTPQQSHVTSDIIERAKSYNDKPLYVVAIGAITNVASAILIEPEIIKNIVVVWLGGNPLYWPHTREFNLAQDIHAARVVFNSGVPLVHLPARGVVSHLLTTVSEMECYVQGNGKIGDYLVKIFKDYHKDHFAWSKVIWDISATAYLVNSSWVPTELVHSPILTDYPSWSYDNSRHFIRTASSVNRDAIFGDLFRKLQNAK